MTREEAKKMLPIIKAFCEGKQIQFLFDEWKDVDEIGIREFLENPELYRIKSEIKYRPFKGTKECWNEIQKHQPIGWVKSKETTEDVYFTITGLTYNTFGVMLNSPGGWSFSGLFDYYTFADGAPFGVKDKE